MTDSTTTETVERGSWQAAYDSALTDSLRRWAENHKGDLAEQLEVFNKKASGDGWYGFESPFGYALRWRAEDIMKAEVSTAIASYVLNLLDGSEHMLKADSPSAIFDLVDSALRGVQASGLRPSSSSSMDNTLAQMRGYAALDFGSAFGSLEQCKWESHYAALKTVAGGAQAAASHARKQLNEVKSALDRTRSASGREREQRKVDAAEENLTAQLNILKVTLALAGAPDEVIESETKRDSLY